MFSIRASLLLYLLLPCQPGWTGESVAVVLNSGDASVTLIDQGTLQPLQTFPVGKEPHHLMATPDNDSLIVANAIGNSLMMLDPKSGKVQRKLTGIEDPYQIGFTPNRKWFVVTCLRLNRVDLYRYDGKNLAIATRLSIPQTPSHMAFTQDSKTVFVTLQDSNELVAIDLGTQKILWKMQMLGKTPAGLWFTPNDQYLMVGMTGEDYVAVVDWRAQKVIKKIQTGKAAHNFRSLADGRHVLVSNRISKTISILDQQTLTKVSDITDLRPGPDDMELTADGRYLWVTFRWDKHVGVIDMTTRKLIKTIPVGKSPHGLYFLDRAPVTNDIPVKKS